MALPASLYAIPEVTRPKRKLSSVQRHSEAKAELAHELELKRNVDQVDRVLTKLEARRAARTALIRSLQKRNAADDARIAKIEDRTLVWMAEERHEKVSGIRITLTARPAPPAVEVLDESQVPQEYWREKLVSSIDKIAVKTDLTKGIEIPGVGLTQKISLIRK